ncbi:MAG: hypothetical protein K2W95_09980 [Candidatus Obscuribacterales bacterium]|nr:hypothetical protein [Candidatus Obscuribacterales bacterium]
MEVINSLREFGFGAGIVVARSVEIRPSSAELNLELEKLINQRKEEEFPPPAVKEAIRGLLKKGGFKPSGRNKPASEYLAQAAREGRFPSINNLVDVNNLISLSSGLPISLLDLDAIGTKLILRFGRENERYVFNNAGQDIDLKGLICACAGATDTPMGNPVKDSMAGKIKDSTHSVIGIVYSPLTTESQERLLEEYVSDFAQWLTREGSAEDTETFMV